MGSGPDFQKCQVIIAPILFSVSPCCSAYSESRSSGKFGLNQASENLGSHFVIKKRT